MLNDVVCRVATDKTRTHTQKKTYRLRTEEPFIYLQVFFFLFSLKKAISKNGNLTHFTFLWCTPRITRQYLVRWSLGNVWLLKHVTEARVIDDASTRRKCMNSQAEWNHQAVPRITIVNDWHAYTFYTGRRGYSVKIMPTPFSPCLYESRKFMMINM